MFVIQVRNLLALYLSRPVSTVVKVEHENVSIFFLLMLEYHLTARYSLFVCLFVRLFLKEDD